MTMKLFAQQQIANNFAHSIDFGLSSLACSIFINLFIIICRHFHIDSESDSGQSVSW